MRLTGGANLGHIIGIDVGSQSVKGILLSPEAETLGVASAACAMTNAAPGWADRAPSPWERGVEQVVRQLISAAGLDSAAVTHLGLACQVDGVVPVNRSEAPLRDGIIWLDRRASAQALAEAVSAGAPVSFSQLAPPVDEEAVRWAVGSCNFVRDRFSVADLASFLGIFDEARVDRLVGDAAALGTLP
jgi:xylulokinase